MITRAAIFFLTVSSSLLFASPSELKADICKKNLAQCIFELSTNLKHTPTATHLWFHQKLTLMDLLFKAQEYKRLHTEVDAILTMPSLPKRVEIHGYMYKVKLASQDKKADLSDYISIVDKAFSDMAQWDAQSIIDYATFQLYTGDYKKGTSLLVALEEKFKSHPNSHIKKQIYTILGYLTHKQNKLDATLSYLQMALENAKKDDDIHYLVMAHYNIARALHFMGRLDEALPLFQDVILQAKKINEASYQSLTNLRIAQISTQKKQLKLAKSAMAAIDTKHLLTQDRAIYKELTLILK
jgi:tetratricopeptide (TPR) repeat protein